jgi:hypothetical protein
MKYTKKTDEVISLIYLIIFDKYVCQSYKKARKHKKCHLHSVP